MGMVMMDYQTGRADTVSDKHLIMWPSQKVQEVIF